MSITEVGTSVVSRRTGYPPLTAPARWLGAEAGIGPVAVLLGIIVAVGISTLFSRGVAAGGRDLRQAARVIGANAHQSDAAVFDEMTRPSRETRHTLRLYPQSFAGLSDVTLRTPLSRRSGLWDSVSPIAEVAPSLQGISTVWDLELTTPESVSTPVNVLTLERLGYSISRQLPVHRTVVYELTRETS